MKVGLLTQWYAPEPGPAALPAHLAEGLAARGHEVQVVTGFPNYPTGVVADGYRQQRRLDEVRNGVKVRRVALYANHDGSAVRRIVNYGSFAASASLSGLDVLRDVDVLWVNYSPVTIGIPMRFQRRLRGTPVVTHVLDLWPDTFFASGFGAQGAAGSLAQKALDHWCGRLYDHSHTVAYISPGVGDVLARRGVQRDKVAYAPMWADERVARPLPAALDRTTWGLGPETVALVYAGTLGGAQDLTTLVHAMAEVRDLDVQCLIAGSGTEERALRRLADGLGVGNVHFLGRLGADEMPALTAASDLQYVGLNDHPLARITMPSKVQAILASARPVVGSLVGDAANVVERSGGWALPPGDTGGLSAAIREAVALGRRGLADRGVAARHLYDAEFSLTTGVSRIEALLEAAAR